MEFDEVNFKGGGSRFSVTRYWPFFLSGISIFEKKLYGISVFKTRAAKMRINISSAIAKMIAI